jgi:hypothetical protein
VGGVGRGIIIGQKKGGRKDRNELNLKKNKRELRKGKKSSVINTFTKFKGRIFKGHKVTHPEQSISSIVPSPFTTVAASLNIFTIFDACFSEIT